MRENRLFIFWFAAFFLSTKVVAYIPPLSILLKDAFEGRKYSPSVEVFLKHQIETQAGEKVTIDERLVSDRGQTLILWSSPLMTQPVAASYANLVYSMGNDRSFATRSGIFLRQFLSAASEPFQESLMGERFLRPEQLIQYRQGAEFTGDPLGWDLRSNYLLHDDIFLHRLESGIAIEVIGLDDGNSRRAFFIDRGTGGLTRLEWREKNQVVGWNFESFARLPREGWYPHRMNLDLAGLETAGKTLISSTLVSRRPLKNRQRNDFKVTWQRARTTSIPSSVEVALKMLLSYR